MGNTYMDHVHEMEYRTAHVAKMRREAAPLAAVQRRDRRYHELRARLGAYLIGVGRRLENADGRGGQQSPSAA